MSVENVVIIGTGPAGYTAAVYTARANLKPLIIEGPQPGGQLTTTSEIENYPGFPEGIDGTTLMMRMRDQAERFGARFEGGDVTASDFTGRPLVLTIDGERRVATWAAIIATGASAMYLGLDSERKLMGRGVSACATCDGALYRDVPIAVVGGGDTALEEALFLTRFASRVTIIHRRDTFRASRIMAERAKAHPKIDIRWNTTIDEILDVAKGEVTGLRLKDVQTGGSSVLEVKGVFMAIGHRPNTQPFVGRLELTASGYIVTDNTKTRVPGVFAAGDVQDHVYRQAVTAAGSGCMAALEAERYLAAILAP